MSFIVQAENITSIGQPVTSLKVPFIETNLTTAKIGIVTREEKTRSQETTWTHGSAVTFFPITVISGVRKNVMLRMKIHCNRAREVNGKKKTV